MATEDEMVGWHHRLNGHELEQAPGDGEGLACCSPWGHKESDTTERLNNIILQTRTLGPDLAEVDQLLGPELEFSSLDSLPQGSICYTI